MRLDTLADDVLEPLLFLVPNPIQTETTHLQHHKNTTCCWNKVKLFLI